MAKVAIPKASFSTPRPLTSSGGLVRAGGYVEKRIDIKSRPRSVKPLKGSIGSKVQALPKGMA